MRPPRNVSNYQVQEMPDGCHNCKKRYLGMVRDVTHQPILACALACHDPTNPSFCDEVDPIGKCDSHEKGDPPVVERAATISFIRLKKPD